MGSSMQAGEAAVCGRPAPCDNDAGRRGSLLRLGALGLGAVGWPLGARAQQTMHRIGFLWMDSRTDDMFDAFRESLREFGYVEGHNVAFVHRYGEASRERLVGQAAELVRLDMDVIVAAGTPCAVIAQQATKKIPVVFYVVADPVAAGLVASLTQPGANLTGVSIPAWQQNEKRLALLMQAAPRVSRVAVLWNPDDRLAASEVEVLKGVAARDRKVQIHPVAVRNVGEFARAFETATQEGAGALSIVATPFIVLNLRRLADLALKHRLPAIFWDSAFPRHGGLMAYGPGEQDIAKRTAATVDKVLKGAPPADLPVEQPTRHVLVINANTARTLGLSLSKPLLAQADQVIG